MDKRSGTLALFQLKWQDAFRHSLRARESRRVNFQETANKWIDRVSSWHADVGTKELARIVGLNEQAVGEVRRVLLFVIGRYGAHFSGPGFLDARAAWGSWYKLLRVVAEGLDSTDPLDEIFDKLRSTSPLRMPLRVDEVRLKIGEVSVIVEAVDRNSAASHVDDVQQL